METKQSYADRLEEAHEHARWVGKALDFLAEVVGGRSVLPDELSEGARLGLGVFLEECDRRIWEAEAMLGVVAREERDKEVAHG